MNIIDYLPPYIKEFTVCIIKTGSQLFCSNCKDSDYLILTNEQISSRVHYINELKADCFIRSIDEFKAEILDDKWRYKLCACLAYRNNENVVYGNLPILETNIFSEEYLRKILAIEYEYAQKTYFVRYPLKSMVWGLAIYYILSNSCFAFTEKQKEILQKAHDLELPIEYRDELKTNIKALVNL